MVTLLINPHGFVFSWCMISDVPKQRTRRRRERDRRSIAEEQESLKTVLTRKDSDGSVSMETTESLSNNNKELDTTQLRNITNAQLHRNNNHQDNATYTSNFTFKSSANQEQDKEHSSRSHSNDSRTSEDSGISSTTRSRYGNRYKRGYHSEGSALRDTQDTTEDSLSSSYGFRNRRREENREDISSSSSSHSRTIDSAPTSEIKYRYTNGSSCDMPSDETRSRRKYNISDDSSKHSTNNRYRHIDDHYGNTNNVDYYNHDNSDKSNSGVPADALSSDSSVSSGGTLTITLSGPDGQSETRIHSSQSPPPLGGDTLGQTRPDVPGQTPRLEGDNISLASTMSSLSTSSVMTTDSCSTMSSDVAKRQSVSSLSDLEHLGRLTCL